MLYLLAFLIGLVAGLRAMTAPAAASWAVRLGAGGIGVNAEFLRWGSRLSW
ncbi:MAG TPA: hypothetical protein VMR54_05010 [Thermoanaerobaculia bacterium]|nr:hypothetical protein [Thermoanaerobaculia bacterium]